MPDDPESGANNRNEAPPALDSTLYLIQQVRRGDKDADDSTDERLPSVPNRRGPGRRDRHAAWAASRWRGRVEHQTAPRILRKHAVEHERVRVDIEVERSPEPGVPTARGLCAVGWESLDDRDRATASVRHAVRDPGAPAQPAEHRPHEHTDHRPTQRVIPRHLVFNLGEQAGNILMTEPPRDWE